jgi:hypothetical protein
MSRPSTSFRVDAKQERGYPAPGYAKASPGLGRYGFMFDTISPARIEPRVERAGKIKTGHG